jgi:hypothetical protein
MSTPRTTLLAASTHGLVGFPVQTDAQAAASPRGGHSNFGATADFPGTPSGDTSNFGAAADFPGVYPRSLPSAGRHFGGPGAWKTR